jgi:putative spermidine/putrescine transport system substrate-binding protein
MSRRINNPRFAKGSRGGRRSRPSMLIVAAVAALLVAGCGSSSKSAAPGGKGFHAPKGLHMAKSVGKGEGELNVLAWPGYAEHGANDPKVNWVKPFSQQTGCKVNVKEFGTSDEAVSLMHAGGYDVVSASGDATLRLIAAGDVDPVNTKLVSNYGDIAPFLKDRSWNSVDGQMYGIPHGWGANLLMYNKSKVSPAPDSWGVVFGGSSKYKGAVTAYDSPIYIADAALYLMKSKPSLGIKNPYSLDQKQLDAAVSLLKEQNKNIGEYWSDYNKEVQSFKNQSLVVGTTWQVIVNLIGKSAPVNAVLPKEGATGWSDTWMVYSKSKHKNCAYKWLNYIVSPSVNAQVAEWFGEAPANLRACEHTVDKSLCKTYHADDAAFAKQIWYWTTPIKQCLDGRTKTTCTDYKTWTDAWTDIKG